MRTLSLQMAQCKYMIPSKLIEFRLIVGREEHKDIRRYQFNVEDGDIEQDFQDWCSNFIDGAWEVIAE
jgi:hypothetical protein